MTHPCTISLECCWHSQDRLYFRDGEDEDVLSLFPLIDIHRMTDIVL